MIYKTKRTGESLNVGMVCGEFQKLKDSEAVDGYKRMEFLECSVICEVVPFIDKEM